MPMEIPTMANRYGPTYASEGTHMNQGMNTILMLTYRTLRIFTDLE